MRQHGPVSIAVYFPKTDAGKAELCRRVADIHAQAVTRRLKRLNCPNTQKMALLDAVIEAAKQKPSPPSLSQPNKER